MTLLSACPSVIEMSGSINKILGSDLKAALYWISLAARISSKNGWPFGSQVALQSGSRSSRGAFLVVGAPPRDGLNMAGGFRRR